MCEAVEEYANEKARIAAEEAEKKAEEKVAQAEKKKAESMAIKMLEAGKYALDEIANLTDLSLPQVQMQQKKI